jgi:hypothetical protein
MCTNNCSEWVEWSDDESSSSQKRGRFQSFNSILTGHITELSTPDGSSDGEFQPKNLESDGDSKGLIIY